MHALLLLAMGWYAVASLAAAAMFWADKRSAEAGRRRVPERVLHALSWSGGWPGSLFAIRRFRHKTRKPVFLVITVFAAVLHVAAWVGAGWMIGAR